MKVCKASDARTKKTAAIVEKIRVMAPGAGASEIARAVGASVSTVIRWAAEEDISLMTPAQARKKTWCDPAVRARMSETMKKASSGPEVRARRSAAMKNAWGDPEARARMRAAIRQTWSDPAVRARRIAAKARARMRASDVPAAKHVKVPAWVPANLQDQYRTVAAESGEEAAASHLRRLKRELAGAAP